MIGKLLGHYQITSQLGKGGMGVVYQAKDQKLGRDVAIKVLPEEFAKDADRVSRFQREAKLLASLNHSNIASIYGLEDSGQTNFLVMELVQGETLSDRIKRCPIPIDESLKLALQIAGALEAAHKKGIIHRDLKPGNIMVTDEGSVKLLDFGLAKLYEHKADATTQEFPATQAGAVLGTVAYMSPEQAQGQPADARSDVFSFGLVLYEMLCGRRAFTGDSNYSIMDAIVKKNPSPLQASPAIVSIVSRCLAKRPSARYQTMSEAKAALEQVSAESGSSGALEPQPSIAVLPFVNMSGDREQEYFSDGLAEEIINALTQIPGLKVIARTSSFAFRGKEQDITRIAEALRVRTILEGSVRKAANRIRVTAQLIDAADGSHIWSERYDRDMTDVFAIQDEISLAIMDKLRIQLVGKGLSVKRYTENVEAYNLYLKGRHHITTKFTQEGFAKGREYFEQAILLDPKYALAWYGLSWLYLNMNLLGHINPESSHAQARLAIRKALELEEKLPQIHCLMAILHATEYDWNGVERELQRALELDPKSSDAWRDYAYWFLIPMRRLNEALEAQQKAVELDPLAPMLKHILGYCYSLLERADFAIEQYRSALELDDRFFLAYLHLGLALISINRIDEGVRAVEAGTQLSGRTSRSLEFLGFVYAKAGRTDEARTVLEELMSLAQKQYVPPSSIGIVYSALGEFDRSMDWLEKACDEHYIGIAQISLDPMLHPLRSHPRYHCLLRKMNLGA